MKAAALVGVLVMAHGGDPSWNKVVEDAVAPLRAARPTALAYGMADADALQDAVFALEKRGVRLFLDGQSFLLRTEKILGLKPGAPERPALADAPAAVPHAHGADGRMTHGPMMMDPDLMPLWRAKSRSAFAMSRRGLLDSGLGPGTMARRVLALSKDPATESVLLVAHGVGDEAGDARWRAAMAPAVEAVRKAAGFRKVAAVTFRDDWPQAHAKALAELKAFVAAAKEDGGRALVVPYRLYGFGPQGGELAGLDIVTDDKGLLPDPGVSRWLAGEADRLVREAGWE